MTELQDRLIQQISRTFDEDVLREIEMILNGEAQHVPYVINQEQLWEIELSRKEIGQGEFVTNEEADREALEWLRNL